jgi:hypothetical protein
MIQEVGCRATCWMSAKSELSSLKSELAVKVLPGLAGRPLPGGQRASILATPANAAQPTSIGPDGPDAQTPRG